jgi:hypothetical protein
VRQACSRTVCSDVPDDDTERLRAELEGIGIGFENALMARILCEFRRTSRIRRYAPAGHLLRGVLWPSAMYNDHAL